ncbi:MAG: hypothetical protein JSS02_14285 [Planctomycetes bacterium]|nr:hypothetical protein [Planctomycetota bacterium]
MRQADPDENSHEIDVHELLAKRRQVAVIWSVEDVQSVRPDLTDDQSWAVLKECERRHDASWGITWISIEIIAGELFPEPSTEKE